MAFLELIAPVHWAISNASIEIMINCMLAQSVDDWLLTIVSDGPDRRVKDIVQNRYHDDRIRYISTQEPSNDHGHSPREFGLNVSRGEWTVLSGIDNYYVPLFVETLRDQKRAEYGLMYWDFLLDMKGEFEAGLEYQSALAAYSSLEAKESHLSLLRPIINGKVIEIFFDPKSEDINQRAAIEVSRLGLTQGGGCDDPACISGLLADAMRQASSTDSRVGGGPPRALPPYSGHIEANLYTSGQIDIGAFAVRTDIAQRIGFSWRHHAADFSYLKACLDELRRLSLQPCKFTQTLYVHN